MVIGIDNFVLYDHHYTETTRILSVGSNPNKMLLKKYQKYHEPTII
jgi:hypothetical protein